MLAGRLAHLEPLLYNWHMDVVIDTSALLAVALDEPEKPALVESTRGAVLVAPEVQPFEIGNALSALCRRGRLSPEEVRQAWRICGSIPVRLVPVNVEEALVLAMAHRIYAYDAYFLVCALRQRAALLTLDRGMARAARAEGITMVE